MMIKNIFQNIPEPLTEELLEVLQESKGVRIERILSRGHASPEGFWYDQERHEWVLLLKGSACLCFEDQHHPVVLRPGDYVLIPAHVRHRVECTDPEQETVWLTVHY